MQEHSVCIPRGKAVVQAATSPHAACIDVQAVPLQMHRPMQPGWLTPPDSIKQGFRACWGREHVAFNAGAAFPQLLPCKMKLITDVRSAQESAVLATHVCSGLGCACRDSLYPGQVKF